MNTFNAIPICYVDGMQDDVNRRQLIKRTGTGLGLSLGAGQIQTVTAENSDQTPPGLHKRPYHFVELTFEVDSVPDQAEIAHGDNAFPNFGIGSNVEHSNPKSNGASPRHRDPVYIPQAPPGWNQTRQPTNHSNARGYKTHNRWGN